MSADQIREVINDGIRTLARQCLDAETKSKRLEAENARLRKALELIADGGYAPNSNASHPAVAVANIALFKVDGKPLPGYEKVYEALAVQSTNAKAWRGAEL